MEQLEMNERLSTLEQDIGFLKALATEGSPATLVGGSIMMLAGAAFGLASVGQWVALAGYLPAYGGWIYPGIWMIALVVFFAGMALIVRRLGPHKQGDVANRAVSSAWSGVGYTIFALFVCAAIIAWRTHSDATLAMLPSIVLALYGLAWSVAANLARKGWMRATAIGSYVAAAVVAAFAGMAAIYLAYAAALVLLAIVPGAAMVRLARAAG
jgi:hypothetical protein